MTTGNNLFYYPYAYFTNQQMPLLKIAALYFDKLYLLDPVGASARTASEKTVGADHYVRDAVKELQSAGILELLSPANVLAKYADQITRNVREDISDPEFLKLCAEQGRGQWRLSLAKVPDDLKTDGAMRHLMGDFARKMAAGMTVNDSRSHDYIEYDETEVGDILQQAAEAHRFRESAPQISTGVQYNEGYDKDVEYRYADFPLALGEAIMVNHALFTGLLHAEATPLTDDLFHSKILTLKMRRAAQDPQVSQIISDRAAVRKIKTDLLVKEALSDPQLELPILNPALPLSEVLDYRHAHEAELQQARKEIAGMARRIQAEPWSLDFAKELETKTIPDISDELAKVRKTRDDWLKSKRGQFALSATGLAVGAAAAVLAVVVAPITPIALATAGLGLVSGTVIPGAQWLLDWRDGKTASQENGLHYFLSYK